MNTFGNVPHAKRLQRDLNRRRALSLTDRDRTILRHCFQTRLLSTDLINALVGAPATEGQWLIRRLRRLFDAGYLDRPRNQIHHDLDPETGRYQGLRKLVYALGTKGAAAAGEEFQNATAGRLRWEKKNAELKALQIEHCLMVARVYTTLHLGLRNAPDADLLFWHEGQALKTVFHTDVDGNHAPRPYRGEDLHRHVVYPDAFFGVSVPGKESGQLAGLYFFLECDRGTMDLGRFLRKLRDYWKCYRLKIHTQTYDIQHFVVLTIALTPARRDNLCALAGEADESKRGSTIFRFACEQDYSLEKPWRFFDRIWTSPGSDRPMNILV